MTRSGIEANCFQSIEVGRTRVPFISALFALSLSATASGNAADPPAFAYLLHCSGCHLEDGSGDPPIVPDLRIDLGLLLDSAVGRSYMLRVPGVTDTPVSPQQMANLLNWMISTFLYPERANFEPFTVDDINAGRANRLNDPLKYRSELFSGLLGDSATASQ